MTWSEVAWLVVAVAFAVLVAYLSYFFVHLTQTVKQVSQIVQEAQKTLVVLRKDVDSLSVETQGLLNKSNQLMEDVNQKVAKIDPLFEAVGEVGESISGVNDSTRNFLSALTKKNENKVDQLKQRCQDLKKSKEEESVFSSETEQKTTSPTASNERYVRIDQVPDHKEVSQENPVSTNSKNIQKMGSSLRTLRKFAKLAKAQYRMNKVEKQSKPKAF